MKDMVVVIGLVVALASLITAHVTITYGLLWRPPRWRAAVALAAAPMAPYWAWREKMRLRAGIWVGAVVLYVIASAISRC